MTASLHDVSTPPLLLLLLESDELLGSIVDDSDEVLGSIVVEEDDEDEDDDVVVVTDGLVSSVVPLLSLSPPGSRAHAIANTATPHNEENFIIDLMRHE